MHINIEEVEGKEISPGVIEKKLLSRDQSSPGGLAVHHYVLSSGELVFGEENTEYQHYIISGCGRMGGRLVHGETAIFVPGAQRWGKVRKHSIAHTGEGELRIITASYKTGRQNFRWAKTRVKNLYETTANISNIVNQQLITEEEHAVMGALRMHALDVQTHAPLANNPAHINPEEIMYVLRGTGEAVTGNSRYEVKPGSLVYAKEGETHGIYNTSPTYPLQYFVLEFIEHDRAWTEKGLQN